MKERIKRFYHEHKTEIIVSGSAIVATMLYAAKKARENQIVSADIWARDDGARNISVQRRNGNTLNFYYDAEELV